MIPSIVNSFLIQSRSHASDLILKHDDPVRDVHRTRTGCRRVIWRIGKWGWQTKSLARNRGTIRIRVIPTRLAFVTWKRGVVVSSIPMTTRRSRPSTLCAARQHSLACLEVISENASSCVSGWRRDTEWLIGPHPSSYSFVRFLGRGRRHTRLGLVRSGRFAFDGRQQMWLATAKERVAKFPCLGIGSGGKQVVDLETSAAVSSPRVAHSLPY